MSQEYDPVTWVDETTSTQGTLINAERLNQMQTAHHYADGFEEVDAVPTADPGTDYHKVVYCTADTTFYRWDGSQWTADIDDSTKALLDQEIARATGREDDIEDDLEAHTGNMNNPHGVTKNQLGLGNVDNTSDLDKPISTATQNALNNKQDNLSFDPEPVPGSNNPVTSGGVYGAIQHAGVGTAYSKAETDTLLAAKADQTDLEALQTVVNGKQAALTAGAGISIVGATISATAPNFTISTNEPTALDGQDGDVWFVIE